jgi:hypothetical protein
MHEAPSLVAVEDGKTKLSSTRSDALRCRKAWSTSTPDCPMPLSRDFSLEHAHHFIRPSPAGWEEAIVEYVGKGSLRRRWQLERLAARRAPNWDEHCKKLEPLTDADLPRMARRQRG